MLPQLERDLLSLLVDFKERNGYDFEFEGVTFLNTLAADQRLATRGSPGRAGSSLGQQILKKKIDDSLGARGRSMTPNKPLRRRVSPDRWPLD
jgi:hypothetical protein